MRYIVRCPKCGRMYKTTGKLTSKGLRYITDYNDDVTENCIICKHKITPIVMETDDWIADLVFKIKGN